MDKPSWEVQEDIEDRLATQRNPEGDWLLPADRDAPLDEHLHQRHRALDLGGCLPWLLAAGWVLSLVLN